MLLRLAVGIVFIVVPMLELVLLIKIGQSIGALATVALVLATAVIGAFIVSRQGLAVVSRTLEAVSQGRPPVEAVLDGLFLLVAGALLLTPGPIGDAVGFALLVPPLRRAIARAGMRWVLRRAEVRIETHTSGGAAESRSSARPAGGPVIEGEFERVDRPPGEPPRLRRDGRPGASV